MTFGSLFTGIGGLDLGLERAGMTCAWQVEIDPYVERPERVDAICGGFPCQDISVAGRGRGLAGERSGLWREFARLICTLKPAWVIIENVPALRSRGLRTVLGDLNACGYDAEWDGFPACAFGAPHRRDRLFVVAHADGKGQLQPRGRIFEGRRRLGDSGGSSHPWAVEPDVGRVAHGISRRVDRLRGLGNAVVPQVAEHVGRRILEAT